MPIDVALLGCAHPHVPDVLGVLASEPDLRLVAAWDADPSAIPVAIAGAAVARAETAIRRANAAVICAPTDQRPALCVQAARAGLPDARRKPVARTAADARGVAREVGRSRTPAMAALFLRELPALARLARRAARAAGRPARERDGGLTHPGAVDGWFNGPRAWMRDPARAGVGGFGDLALQLVDALERPAGRRAARARRRRARPARDRAGRRRRRRARARGRACRSRCARAGRRGRAGWSSSSPGSAAHGDPARGRARARPRRRGARALGRPAARRRGGGARLRRPAARAALPARRPAPAVQAQAMLEAAIPVA